MRIYQSTDDKWILWTGTEKLYFTTEDEAKMAEKKLEYTEDVRQLVRDYIQIMERVNIIADSTNGNWATLYNSVITEDDLSGDIIPIDGQTKLQMFGTVISNMRTLLTAYRADIDASLERVA